MRGSLAKAIRYDMREYPEVKGKRSRKSVTRRVKKLISRGHYPGLGEKLLEKWRRSRKSLAI